jgi:ribosomal protein L37E
MIKPEELPVKVPAALSEKKTNPACISCGSNSWAVIPKIVTITLSEGDGFIMPPPNVPATALICTHCGFIRLHSLIALGLMEPFKEKEVSS